MGDVIGYKGTAEDRTATWLTMLQTRSAERVFNKSDEKEAKSLEVQRKVYKYVLENYVKAA